MSSDIVERPPSRQTAVTTGWPRAAWRHVRDAAANDEGSSPVTAVGGLMIFLGFLFLAVQVTVHLYTTSTAGAVALEAATRAAQSPDPIAGACATSTTWADQQLGGWASPTRCGRAPSGNRVEVTVSGNSPAASMRVFSALTGLNTINRSATVRREEFTNATP